MFTNDWTGRCACYFAPGCCVHTAKPRLIEVVVTIFTSSIYPKCKLMFDHLLELYQRDNSNTWSNIGIGKEITQLELFKVSLSTSYRTMFIT